MQISTRYSIALHILVCIDIFSDKEKITSDYLAKSIQVNPVIIRKILQQLKRANILQVNRGSGGATLLKDSGDIDMYEVYKAVSCVDENGLFNFHDNPNPHCLIGKNIKNTLEDKFVEIQTAMENKMKNITLKDIVDDINNLL